MCGCLQNDGRFFRSVCEEDFDEVELSSIPMRDSGLGLHPRQQSRHRNLELIIAFDEVERKPNFVA